jgi:hypothetical protein
LKVSPTEFLKASKPAKPTVTGSDYYIVPPEGGEPVKYQRMTRFIDVFADKSNLIKRDIRFAVAGSVKYADKLAELNVEDDRYEIDQIADKAGREAGKWHSADYGTAMHALTEDYDNGFLTNPDFKTIPDTPAVSELERGPMNMLNGMKEAMAKDLMGYVALVEAYQIETVHAESTIVIDDYRVAGTTDRFSKINNPMTLPYDDEADCTTVDLKTGRIDYGRREKAMQLAGYSISQLYNPTTHERKDHGASRKLGYIIHSPAGKGVSEIVAVKLERPIKFLAKAHEIQEIRKTKEVWERRGLEDWLSAEIDKIETEDDLKVLYFKTKPYWTLDHGNKAKNKF